MGVWPSFMMFSGAFLAALVSWVGTGVVRAMAHRVGLIDRPNDRSSHQRPTPRGGGCAIVAGVAVGTLMVAGSSYPSVLPWLAGALAIAVVGFIDDLRGLTAANRLAVHAAGTLLVLGSLELQPVPWLGGAIQPGLLAYACFGLASIWSINAFNFMDGTDGLAAGQATFVFAAAAVLGSDGPSFWLLATFAAAALGFLPWNWPRAAIFMGDVGSGFLGILVVVGAFASSGMEGVSLWTWLVLHGLFIADATTTLLVRAARREKVFQAHRSHVYQRLARRWESHGRVLAGFLAVDLLVMLPIAAATIRLPALAGPIAIATLLALCGAAYVLGAGRADG